MGRAPAKPCLWRVGGILTSSVHFQLHKLCTLEGLGGCLHGCGILALGAGSANSILAVSKIFAEVLTMGEIPIIFFLTSSHLRLCRTLRIANFIEFSSSRSPGGRSKKAQPSLPERREEGCLAEVQCFHGTVSRESAA